MTEETVVYIRLGPQGQQPLYATAGSAGCDLFAAADLSLLPGESRVMPLDFTLALEPGVEAQIRPRSGLSLKTSLRIPNSPGTVDSDYRSPVGVLLQNTFSLADLPLLLIRKPDLAKALAQPGRQTSLLAYLKKHQPTLEIDQLAGLGDQVLYLDEQGWPYGTLHLKEGERIAQMVLVRVLRASFLPHERPEEIGQDRGGGFGSTGL